MNSLIGWIGLALLLAAWSLQVTRYKKHFFLVCGVASLILTVYAIIIIDLPFIIVNGFIAAISFVKALAHHKKDKKGKKKFS